jgi:hypothetical protein
LLDAPVAPAHAAVERGHLLAVEEEGAAGAELRELEREGPAAEPGREGNVRPEGVGGVVGGKGPGEVGGEVDGERRAEGGGEGPVGEDEGGGAAAAEEGEGEEGN